MLKETDDIVALIRSMTVAEKRYFKNQATRHTKGGSNNYVTLFDAIDKLKPIEERKLTRRLTQSRIGNHLATVKYQLYLLLVRCLTDYRSGKSLDSELQESYNQALTLFERGLYAQCRKFLDKARLRAEENERYVLLLELLKLERRILLMVHQRDFESRLETILAEEKEIIGRVANQSDYFQLYCSAMLLEKTASRARTVAERSRLDDIMNTPFMRDEAEARSFTARIYFHKIRAIHASASGNTAAAQREQRTLLDLWHSRTDEYLAAAAHYKKDLINYLNFCLSSDDFDDFEDILGRIKALQPVSIDDQIKTFQDVCHVELLYCLQRGLYEQGQQVIAEIADGIHRYEGRLVGARSMALFYNITVFYFMHGQLSEALSWLERILVVNNAGYRRDIQSFARLLLPLIHFEMGNTDLVETLLRSAYRYLQSRDALHEFERLVIRCLKRLHTLPEGPDQRAEMQNFLTELTRLSVRPESRSLLGLNEFQMWLHSSIDGLPLYELYRRRTR